MLVYQRVPSMVHGLYMFHSTLRGSQWSVLPWQQPPSAENGQLKTDTSHSWHHHSIHPWLQPLNGSWIRWFEKWNMWPFMAIRNALDVGGLSMYKFTSGIPIPISGIPHGSWQLCLICWGYVCAMAKTLYMWSNLYIPIDIYICMYVSMYALCI